MTGPVTRRSAGRKQLAVGIERAQLRSASALKENSVSEASGLKKFCTWPSIKSNDQGVGKAARVAGSAQIPICMKGFLRWRVCRRGKMGSILLPENTCFVSEHEACSPLLVRAVA